MDNVMTLIVVAGTFCALLVSVFMVAYRYNSMSREIRSVSSQLRKLARAHGELAAPLLAYSEQKAAEKEAGGGQPLPTATVSLADSSEWKNLETGVRDILSRLDALDQLLDERLRVPAPEPMPTIPMQAPPEPEPEPPPPPEPPPAEPPLSEPEPEKPPVEMPAPRNRPAKPEKKPPPKRSPKEKTVIRCPVCSRQLPYDSLKMQDEQTCPFCNSAFRSNSYLLTLITEGERERLAEATKKKT